MSRHLNNDGCRLKIKEIATYLPAHTVTNEEIGVREPDWDMQYILGRTGVKNRHFAKDGETALDLAERACRQLFDQYPSLPSQLDALIFCTQSPDFIMPPNSCILHSLLQLDDRVATFDYNLACSGYIYGLAIAQGMMSARLASNILLVTADTYSKYMSAKDRSVYTLFGDGAAVSWLSGENSVGDGLVDISLATSGKEFNTFIVPAGGCRLPKTAHTSKLEKDIFGSARSKEHIHMRGQEVLSFVKAKIPDQVAELLRRNEISLRDIDLIVPHQASRTALEALAKLLDVPQDKIYSNLLNVGNTVSASIPMAIKAADREGCLRRGDLVLLIGFGVGLSYASALMRY